MSRGNFDTCRCPTESCFDGDGLVSNQVPDYLKMAERRDVLRICDCWEGFICRILKGDDLIAAMSSSHNVRHTLLPCQCIFRLASINPYRTNVENRVSS